MKTLKNTLEAVVDKWSDPGDYPNGIASGPLPSYNYVSDVNGEVRIELSAEEATQLTALLADEDADLDEWIAELDIDLPAGVFSVKWHVFLIEGLAPVAVLHPRDIESDPDYCESDYYDYDDYGD